MSNKIDTEINNEILSNSDKIIVYIKTGYTEAQKKASKKWYESHREDLIKKAKERYQIKREIINQKAKERYHNKKISTL